MLPPLTVIEVGPIAAGVDDHAVVRARDRREGDRTRAGKVTSIVAAPVPPLPEPVRVMALSERFVVPPLEFREISDVPTLTSVLANAWLLVPLDLPSRLSVPPPRERPELPLRMLLVGAPLAVKSSLSVPLLTVVAPCSRCRRTGPACRRRAW